MTVKAALSILALGIVACSFAQKSGDWRKSNQSPLQVAAKVDSALLNLKNAEAKGFFRCEYPTPGLGSPNMGQVLVNQQIRDRNNFRFDLIRITDGTGNPLSNPLLIGTKGSLYYFSAVPTVSGSKSGLRKLKAGTDPGILTGQGGLIKRWPRNFVQIILQSYVTGKGGIVPFVKELLGKSGYSVRVETRTLQAADRQFPQIRIIATRNAAEAKRLGSSQFEIITDSLMWLPLQVRSIEYNLANRKSLYEWTPSWMGPRKFEDKVFAIPAG